MKLTTDTSACVGAGQCALVAGEVFDQDDDGIVVILDDSPGPAHAEYARNAAMLCPARAIMIEE